MKFDMAKPCESCPYRRDAPRALWAKEEFQKLLHHTRVPFPGAIYGCHGTGKFPVPHVCAGWLRDQREHGYPSIALRMRMLRDEAALLCAENVQGDGDMFESVEDMIAFNFPELLETEKAP